MGKNEYDHQAVTAVNHQSMDGTAADGGEGMCLPGDLHWSCYHLALVSVVLLYSMQLFSLYSFSYSLSAGI